MSRIALVIGHNARAQGAVRVTDGRTEYDWCGLLAAMVMALDPARYVILRRPTGLTYSGEIRAAYDAVNASGAVASIELHFNGAAAETATGTETLSSGTQGSMRLASLIQPRMVRALGLRDRGVKIIKRADRGGESLWAGRPPAVLIEPYFGSRRQDCIAADAAMAQLAGAIHDACSAFIQGK